MRIYAYAGFKHLADVNLVKLLVVSRLTCLTISLAIRAHHRLYLRLREGYGNQSLCSMQHRIDPHAWLILEASMKGRAGVYSYMKCNPPMQWQKIGLLFCCPYYTKGFLLKGLGTYPPVP